MYCALRMVEEIANSLSEHEKEQLSRKSLYAKSEEWQSIMQDKKPSFFDQPIKMELDKIPSKEVGECLHSVLKFILCNTHLLMCSQLSIR